jgi:hypothetical protein
MAKQSRGKAGCESAEDTRMVESGRDAEGNGEAEWWEDESRRGGV